MDCWLSKQPGHQPRIDDEMRSLCEKSLWANNPGKGGSRAGRCGYGTWLLGEGKREAADLCFSLSFFSFFFPFKIRFNMLLLSGALFMLFLLHILGKYPRVQTGYAMLYEGLGNVIQVRR